MQFPIYMDHHATTPVDPRVLEAMLPCFGGCFGNPASQSHSFGWAADRLVEKGRAQIASLIGSDPKEVLFTAGASEANNLAIKGAAELYREKGNHIITQATEHKSVLQPCRYLEQKGFEVTYLPVDENGLVRPEDLRKAINERTILITIMLANNEIGTIQPIAQLAGLAKERGVIVHVDAAQALGKVPIAVTEQGIDLLSASAHKMYGPKGIGALYVRKHVPRIRLAPQIHGGGQEEGLRSGTVNVPGVVGFGAACEIAGREMDVENERIRRLRDRLLHGFQARLADVHLNGHPEQRLCHNLNLSFLYADGESLLSKVGSKIAVSTGSACISSLQESSYVLKSLGLSPERIQSSVRFGLGRFTTEEEVDCALEKFVDAVKKIRAVSPVYQMIKQGSKGAGK
ncbi:IscS subfamily cysteine desulfurase [Omnitrophica bacterium]|nr:IscS subfamily cysteine desulfurase [Candidatus Omnitrophota bacterium]